MKFLFITFVCIFSTLLTHAQPLIECRDLLPEHTFTPGMEGPAVDKYGNLYAVNYQREGTIGIVYPNLSHEIYIVLPEGSVGNGIRFDKKGYMYIADYTNHNILRVHPRTKKTTVFVHEPQMNQPNDIAMAPNGIIYASDPDWKNNVGRIWMINKRGKITCLETGMGTANGIEVSPDGKKLYVGESAQQKVWVYDIIKGGNIINKRLFYNFPNYGLDGMRCDIEGNLYIARYDKGTVVILSPAGQQIREITLVGKKPSNLTFGGKDRKRCYVTMADRGCFEYFEAKYKGRE